MKKATQQPIRSQHLAPGVRHRCAAAVAACFMADPTVVNGSATFNQAGNTLTVTNSHGAIINWQQFSIGAGQTTHFQQSSSASTVLNRVLGGNVSAIYGTLSSNGQVWLVNPAGIMVGAGGVVDVRVWWPAP